ncbi:MAG TPA: hypothetical protein VJV96_14240 [Candidatus Angelobacter sp.]|nr:hypothetical protein [Candidatus Angelobacter sp.]
MATIAAPGRVSSAPAISAAVFQQNHFRARQTRFSLTPKLYFHDHNGTTLAFVRNLRFQWNRELRVFTDPTLSFELLTITPTAEQPNEKSFDVFDPVNREPVGKIRIPHVSGLQKQEWNLFDRTGVQVGHFQENSAMLAAMRRYLSEALPQTYTFYGEDRIAGHASLTNGLFSPEMEIDVCCDDKKPLDRRLVLAVLVIVWAGRTQQARS